MKTKIALLFFLMHALLASAQEKDYNFTSLTTKNGLSSNTINAIVKDKYGFMWFATDDGLNKYDGRTFTAYRHKEADDGSIARGAASALTMDKAGNLWVGTNIALSIYNKSLDNFVNYDFTSVGWIRCLLTDHAGKIWVGTYSGLAEFDPATRRVRKFTDAPADPGKLISKTILCIFEDSRRNIWVGTNAGLHLFDRKKQTFRRFLRNPADSSSVSDNLIRSITEDTEGNLWIATGTGGLNKLDWNTRTFEAFRHSNTDSRTLSSDRLYKVVFDRDGKLWIGTEEGLDVFDPKTGQVLRIDNAHMEKYDFVSRSAGRGVREIFIDPAGIYWIGRYQGGVHKYDRNLAFFHLKQYNPAERGGLAAGSVISFAENQEGRIFVGTDGGGLNVYDRRSGKITPLKLQGSLGDAWTILSLLCREDSLWVGTYQDGLFAVNMTDGKMRNFSVPKSKVDVANVPVNCVLTDRRGTLWIGTNGSGVYLLDRYSGRMQHFAEKFPVQEGRNLPMNGYITSLVEDKEGNVWIASNGAGLAVCHVADKKYFVYNHANSGLPVDRVFSVFCDNAGKIWAGVQGGGLCLFNSRTKHFQQYDEAYALNSSVVYAILQDDLGKLWVSTNKGISVFDQHKKVFRNFGQNNGIQQNTFNVGSALRSASGEMFFGGLEGFNYFNPSTIVQNKNVPDLVLTELKINNKVANPADNSEISDHISLAKRITLSYRQNFSLDFTALNYTSPQESQYSYKLEGFDKEWVQSGNVTTAVYTNLDPGTYQFRLKARSEDGSWQTPERVLEVLVKPPFWRTYTAYFLYALAFFGTLWLIRRRGIQKLRYEFAREQERLEVQHLIEKERLDAEKKMELEQTKVKFLTNLSHELKTPLTLVMNPVENLLLKERSAEKLEMLQLINRNARRLLNLVNQLLDFKRIDANELSLIPSEGELVSFVKEVFDSFRYVAVQREIALTFSSAFSEYRTMFDHDKLERILINLLSNALKFTGSGGTIGLRLESGKADWIQIKISDTGIGMSSQVTEQIFERFYQVQTGNDILNQGSGIGLSIAQEFARLQGGNIDVESEMGVGSSFSLHLPLKALSFTESTPETGAPMIEPVLPADGKSVESPLTERPVILVVDDSPDLRAYLAESLRRRYRIVEAADGKQGWQKALASHPQIIVSDVNMPGMDGIEMVKKIKNDNRTKHIPIIMLTVAGEEVDQLKGLESGAHDYLTKPFSFQLLSAKIENLLKLNNNLKTTYSKHIQVGMPEPEIESEDGKFLLKVSQYIEDHIEDPDLTVEELSKVMFVSRGTLYSKILNLTGEAPVEFVRSVKLKKSLYLLEKSDMKIAQVGYAVGFSNPSYFTRAFKMKYGMSPSEYVQMKRGNQKLPVTE